MEIVENLVLKCCRCRARVRRAHRFGHLRMGISRSEGLKLLGEMGAQSFPLWPHPEDMPALAAFAARQPAGDLAAVLEDIEMSPRQHFGVVIAENQAAVFGTAHQLPELGRLANLQKHRPAFPLKSAFNHYPAQS